MDEKLLERIAIDPEVLHGKPRIKGTRIPVSLILDNLAAGHDEAYLLSQFPGLRPGDAQAAIAYASKFIQGWHLVEQSA